MRTFFKSQQSPHQFVDRNYILYIINFWICVFLGLNEFSNYQLILQGVIIYTFKLFVYMKMQL